MPLIVALRRNSSDGAKLRVSLRMESSVDMYFSRVFDVVAARREDARPVYDIDI
jgi:hypothetical protein